MTSTDLATTTGSLTALSLHDVSDIGKVFAQSGCFKDATDPAKAIVKIIAGQEMGIPPVQAMNGFTIIPGQPPRPNAGLVGALIKRSGRYDYRIAQRDEDACVLRFFENGEEVGVASFTMDDAKKAGLAGKDVWNKYRRSMLFARALTDGARTFCPDVFGGAVYTAEEVEDTPREVQQPPARQLTPVSTAEPVPSEPVYSYRVMELRKEIQAMSDDDRKALKAYCLEHSVEADYLKIYEHFEKLGKSMKAVLFQHQADTGTLDAAQTTGDEEPRQSTIEARTAEDAALDAMATESFSPEPPVKRGRLTPTA